MKSILKTVNDHGVIYQALIFICPGCISGGPDGYDGLHMLPVNVKGDINKPSWEWNEDLENPTISPSILSHGYSCCHSFLKNGVFEFLTDSDHPLSGQNVPIPDLPDWVLEMNDA